MEKKMELWCPCKRYQYRKTHHSRTSGILLSVCRPDENIMYRNQTYHNAPNKQEFQAIHICHLITRLSPVIPDHWCTCETMWCVRSTHARPLKYHVIILRLESQPIEEVSKAGWQLLLSSEKNYEFKCNTMCSTELRCHEHHNTTLHASFSFKEVKADYGLWAECESIVQNLSWRIHTF